MISSLTYLVTLHIIVFALPEKRKFSNSTFENILKFLSNLKLLSEYILLNDICKNYKKFLKHN